MAAKALRIGGCEICEQVDRFWRFGYKRGDRARKVSGERLMLPAHTCKYANRNLL